MKLKSILKYTQLIIYFQIILFLSPGQLSFAQRKEVKKVSVKSINKWSLDLSLQSGYDSNILRYSDKYIERFKNKEDEGRFHIDSYDDLRVDYTIRLSYSDKIIKKLNSIFSASIDYNTYAYNSVKWWSSFDIGLQQYISNETSVRISYSHLPDYYVAHFRDEDWVNLYGNTPQTFQPYSFSKNDYSIWAQHSFLSSTKARVYFSYMKYYYNEHFTEYDSDNIMYGVRIFQDVTTDISADAGYRHVTSDAKGYDETTENKDISDDVDATYHENIFFAGISFQLPKLFGLINSLKLSTQYSKRIYETNNSFETDPLHAGRRDENYRINMNYDVDIFRSFTAGIFFNRLFRNTRTTSPSNREFVSNEKDYSLYQIGLNFNYQIRF